jgi:hypothetical protein
MAEETYLVPNPGVPAGEDTWVKGGHLPVSQVLHALSVGGSIDRVLTSPLITRKGRNDLVPEAVGACVAHALRVLGERKPPPPVAAGFVERWRRAGVSISQSLAEEWAHQILPPFADGRASDWVESGFPEDQVKVAFSYAAALVRNGRFRADEHDDESVRDSLTSGDRQLVEDFFMYRSEIAGHRLTPERLRNHWRQLVQDLEEGYDDDIGELTNDLDGRDILEHASSLVSPLEPEGVQEGPRSARRAIRVGDPTPSYSSAAWGTVETSAVVVVQGSRPCEFKLREEPEVAYSMIQPVQR